MIRRFASVFACAVAAAALTLAAASAGPPTMVLPTVITVKHGTITWDISQTTTAKGQLGMDTSSGKPHVFTTHDVALATMDDVSGGGGGASVCLLHNAGDLTFTSGSFQDVTWDTEDRVDGNYTHSTSVNAQNVTVLSSGVYLIVFEPAWMANATGVRFSQLQDNGVTLIGANFGPPSPVTQTTSTATWIQALAANDVIKVQGDQSSGGNLVLLGRTNGGARDTTSLWISKIGS